MLSVIYNTICNSIPNLHWVFLKNPDISGENKEYLWGYEVYALHICVKDITKMLNYAHKCEKGIIGG